MSAVSVGQLHPRRPFEPDDDHDVVLGPHDVVEDHMPEGPSDKAATGDDRERRGVLLAERRVRERVTLQTAQGLPEAVPADLWERESVALSDTSDADAVVRRAVTARGDRGTAPASWRRDRPVARPRSCASVWRHTWDRSDPCSAAHGSAC